MKVKSIFFLILFIPLSICYLSGETIERGDWFQTSSTAGDSSEIVMSIIQITPHIIQLDSNNGWVGYAWYSETEDEYTGFFELLKDTGYRKDGWTNQVFRIRLIKEGKTITLEGRNETDESFTATFRMQRKL